MSEPVISLPNLIERARCGDSRAGEIVLRLFIWRASRPITKDPYTKDLHRYIAEALEGVLDGDDPREAFNIKRPAHRPRDRGREKLERMSREVLYCLLVSDFMSEGKTHEDAVRQVAENLHTSESVVKKAYSTHKSGKLMT